MELEPNDLLLFARVADEGSFTAASTRLGLPKSTVSRTIQRWFKRSMVFEDNKLKYRRPFTITLYERVGDGPCRYER